MNPIQNISRKYVNTSDYSKILQWIFIHCSERDDAVRMIMTGLLDDDRDGSDLAMELARGVSESRTSQVHSGDPNDSFFTEELTNKPEDWHPDPREADPGKRNSNIHMVL